MSQDRERVAHLKGMILLIQGSRARAPPRVQLYLLFIYLFIYFQNCNGLGYRNSLSCRLILRILFHFFSDNVSQRKTATATKQNSSKILVRNVPFEATRKELKELFG